MAEYLNKYDTTAQYTAESNDRAALGETVSLVTLDGKVYYDRSTVKIGDKVYNVVKMPDGKRWLAQNLDWVPNGVTLIRSAAEFVTDAPACSYYNYTNNGRGLSYNAQALNVISQSLPEGWRVASPDDWNTLMTAIGGNTVANLRKIRSTEHWPTSQGTDELGLNIEPNGDSRWDLPDSAYFLGGVAYIRTTGSKRARLSDNEILGIGTTNTTSVIPIRLVKG